MQIIGRRFRETPLFVSAGKITVDGTNFKVSAFLWLQERLQVADREKLDLLLSRIEARSDLKMATRPVYCR